MINHIHQTIILVSDMARSVAFYRDGLGLPLHFATAEWAEFKLANISITLRLGTESAAEREVWGAGQVTLGFEVTELTALAQHMTDGGLVFNLPPTVQPDAGGIMALVCDPDGVPIMLYQPS